MCLGTVDSCMCRLTEVAAQCVGDLGGVTDVINAMSQFPNHVAVQTACCNALWSLAVNGRCFPFPGVGIFWGEIVILNLWDVCPVVQLVWVQLSC